MIRILARPPYRLLPTRLYHEVKEWQSKPLEDLYTIVWLDAMHYKIKENHRMVSHAVYNILGIDRHGRKELIGMYVSPSQGAYFG